MAFFQATSHQPSKIQYAGCHPFPPQESFVGFDSPKTRENDIDCIQQQILKHVQQKSKVRYLDF